jgi:hypothetical protein
MKALGETGSIAPTHSWPGTRRGWVVSVTPRPRFTPGERTPGTHCTGDWMGLRARLDTEVRGKILCLCRGSNLELHNTFSFVSTSPIRLCALSQGIHHDLGLNISAWPSLLHYRGRRLLPVWYVCRFGSRNGCNEASHLKMWFEIPYWVGCRSHVVWFSDATPILRSATPCVKVTTDKVSPETDLLNYGGHKSHASFLSM